VLFYREFWSTYHSTGAILPSGRSLARALTHFVRSEAGMRDAPRRILEVGPGTGAVTREIVRALEPEDRLDLVELNDRFVAHLTGKLASDGQFAAAKDRVRIIHAPVQQVPADVSYDLIVSGLPLNNFTPELVREIVEKLWNLLAPGGKLSFFEYIAIRRAKAAVSSRAERLRLAEIESILSDLLRKHEVRRDRVLRNVPPAWVHHLQLLESDAKFVA
jgi:phospholipid N-methyltransferase